MKKKIISVVLAVCLLVLCMPLASGAEEPIPELTEADLFITEEVAEYIAGFFIDDMIATGQTVWTGETEIINTVTMYDEAGEITAYTFELTQGYVVVSAYLDMPDIITEWADEAEPVYEEFDLEEDDKIVYVDALDYYLDEGEETLETVGGVEVPREEVENGFEEMRDIENVEEEVIEEIVDMKEEAPRTLRAGPTNGLGGIITDPFIFARNVYGGTWTANNWGNHWEGYANFAVQNNFSNSHNNCGPVAITNLIKMYGKKYGQQRGHSQIVYDSVTTVYNKVIQANNDNNQMFYNQYYNGADGTSSEMANMFIYAAFNKYNVPVSVTGRYSLEYSNALITLGSATNRLMYLMLSTRPFPQEQLNPYGAHSVVGYAYTRLRNQDFSKYRAFIKIADGQVAVGRYIEIDSLAGSQYWEVHF